MDTILEQLERIKSLQDKHQLIGDELRTVNDKLESEPDNHGLKTRGLNLATALHKLEEQIRDAQSVDSTSLGDGHTESGDGASHYTNRPGALGKAGAGWADVAAQSLTKSAKQFGVKALTSGQVDAPGMVRTGIFPQPENPARVLDLLVNRQSVPGNEYEFLRQTVRTDNAAAVADNALKPTSVYTVESIQDRVRVYAHLSEPVPQRLFADHADLLSFLDAEMGRGVLDALEADVVNGASASENVTGILNTAGIQLVAFTTSIYATMRAALRTMQAAHEDVTAWLINPAESEAFDIGEGSDGQYLAAAGLTNITKNLPVVVSTSVPAGTGILADWRAAQLYVRESTVLELDNSGALFERNQVRMRAEGRFGFALNRPAAFASVTLAGP